MKKSYNANYLFNFGIGESNRKKMSLLINTTYPTLDSTFGISDRTISKIYLTLTEWRILQRICNYIFSGIAFGTE